MSKLTVNVDKIDINLELQPDKHLLVKCEGNQVNIVFTPQALEELLERYVELIEEGKMSNG